MDKLFPLTENDIKAIGYSRVNKANGNKQTYWLVGLMLIMSAGVFVNKVNSAVGWGFLIVGAVGSVYYMDKLSKKQKEVVNKLLGQWRGLAK